MLYLIHARWQKHLQSLQDTRILYAYPNLILVERPQPIPGIPDEDIETLDEHDIRVHGVPVSMPTGRFDLDNAPHTLVRFIGPVAQAWRDDLTAKGIEVLFWCPRFGACVRFPAETDAASIPQKFPYLISARPYTEQESSRSLPRPTRSPLPQNLYDLVCFSREDRTRVEGILSNMGIDMLDTSSSTIRVRYDGDPATLREIVGVKIVDMARKPELLGIATTTAVQPNPLRASLNADVRYDGSGQIIAVTDTGLDTGINNDSLHDDFKGRVRSLESWSINPSWEPYLRRPHNAGDASDDNSSHGTHVAGLALGDGSRSNGQHQGIAPSAELVFQAIEHRIIIKNRYSSQIRSGYYLAGRPLNLRELFQAAYDQDARIHVNAWGDAAQGYYTDDSFETDLFLHGHTDAVIIFAAGNAGADVNGDATGDPYTLYAPATAKNAISVGATEGLQANVGFRASWGETDRQRQRYTHSVYRDDPVSGDLHYAALFSSSGPTRDGRIKPDVCAPGTNLVAPRSSQTNASGWGLADPLPHYFYNGGSSMSAGVLGGFIALLRQAWTEHLGSSPSGMALKALTVLGTAPVQHRLSDLTEERNTAGFGRVTLSRSLPQQDGRKIILHDEAETDIMTGETRAFSVNIASTGQLRAVLTWYDAPGEVLMNDLDLRLEDANGLVAWGNHQTGEVGTADRVNTVEVIDIPQLPAGEYTLTVTAVNVLNPPQFYALAIALPNDSGSQSTDHTPQPVPVDDSDTPDEPSNDVDDGPIDTPDPEWEERPVTPEDSIPLNFLFGVPHTVTIRLNDKPVQSVAHALEQVQQHLLSEIGIEGGASHTTLYQLTVLYVVLNAPALATLPQQMTLADLLQQDEVPPNVEEQDWLRLHSDLQVLASIFDPDRLQQTTLQQLRSFIP